MERELHIGFTGTQIGMTSSQHQRLIEYLAGVREWCYTNGFVPVFHHGDCIGSDDQAARTAKELGFRVEAHPPSNPKKRAWCVANDVVYPGLPYLERNHKIVDGAHYMVATPQGPEVIRSGTWATIRYSQLRNKFITVFDP